MIKITMMSRLVICALIMTAVFSTAVIFFLGGVEDRQEKVVVEQVLNKKQRLLDQMNAWVNENSRSLALLAKSEAFLQSSVESQSAALSSFVETYPWVSVAFVTDAEGNALARSDEKTLRSYRDREYIQQIISGEVMGQQILIGKAKPIPLECLSLPILHGEDLAMIVTQCSSLLSVQNLIAAGGFGQTGRAFLLDKKQRLLAYGDGADISARLQDFSQHPALLSAGGSDDQVIAVDVDGVKRVVSVSTVSNHWVLVVMQDYQEAYEDYLTVKQHAVLAIFVFTFALLLLVLWLRASVILPLKVLKQAADDFSQGRFNEEAAYSHRDDELGDMAKALDRLGVCLRMALKRIRSL